MKLVERAQNFFGKAHSPSNRRTSIDDDASLLMIASKLPFLSEAQRRAIARLNDQARAQLGEGCTLCTTDGFLELYAQDRDEIVELVKHYDAFDLGTNIYNERDFGVLFKRNDGRWTPDTPDGDWSHGAVFWFMSYLSKGDGGLSSAPWDEAQTERVLTLILPSEYI
jgi:Protein of unknown function (DUF3768)